jgi:peptide/nickel transport system permease protein
MKINILRRKPGIRPITDLSAKTSDEVYTLSNRQLIWRNYRKHKLAFVSLITIIIIFTVSIFCGFFSPFDPFEIDASKEYQPPQRIRIFDQGRLSRPFVYGFTVARNPETLQKEYVTDTSQKSHIRLFVRSWEYKLLGLVRTRIHLWGTDTGTAFLIGADSLGRDMLSRVLHGGRISTSIGLVGVILTAFLGITVGGIAGLSGGIVDNIIQRIVDLLRSIPKIPLWMGLSAALPSTWPPVRVYVGIVIILSLIGWTELGRVVRSKFLSLREENYVSLARLAGATQTRIITRHMIPAFMSHIVAAVTLSIPQMILAETSLSFLGIGLRPPTISWGVLLKSAQNVRTVALAPWLLLPGLAVIITVLSFNFAGDGLRDAADPYAGVR